MPAWLTARCGPRADSTAGFTFRATNLPGTRAGVEVAELVAIAGDRTRVSYTMALEPVGLLARLAAPVAPIARLTIGRALAELDRYPAGLR